MEAILGFTSGFIDAEGFAEALRTAQVGMMGSSICATAYENCIVVSCIILDEFLLYKGREDFGVDTP